MDQKVLGKAAQVRISINGAVITECPRPNKGSV
jgi:hypothetical protein